MMKNRSNKYRGLVLGAVASIGAIAAGWMWNYTHPDLTGKSIDQVRIEAMHLGQQVKQLPYPLSLLVSARLDQYCDESTRVLANEIAMLKKEEAELQIADLQSTGLMLAKPGSLHD